MLRKHSLTVLQFCKCHCNNTLPFRLLVIDWLHGAESLRIHWRLSQDISHTLWKPKLHYRVIPIMGHINPFHALRFYFFKIHLNITLQSILPSTLIRNPRFVYRNKQYNNLRLSVLVFTTNCSHLCRETNIKKMK